MSEDRSSSGQKSWLGKLTQAFTHEPKNRQELLQLLREAHQNKQLVAEALAIVEGAIQVADLQVRDGVIEIRALRRNPREGWAADAQRLAQQGDDALVWPEFANAADTELDW